MLETDRLLLRPWKPADIEPFADLNADPEVMEFFPATMTLEETERWVRVVNDRIDARGYGFWAVEEKSSGQFVGLTGISKPNFEEHFTPAIEVGWRLARHHWGKGYATEAAGRSLDFGFGELDLDEIVAFAVPDNTRSRAVMVRLGMTHDPADTFDHPKIEGRRKRHVLYRMPRNRWERLRAGSK